MLAGNCLRPTKVPSIQRKSRKRKHPGDPGPSPQRTRPPEDAFGEPAIGSDPVAFWVKEGRWPKEQDWPEETTTHSTMDRLPLARKRASFNLFRKRSNSATSTTPSEQTPSEQTPSDQKPREQKSALYRDQRYETLLKVKGSYMTKAPAPLGIDSASQALCRSLLKTTQPVPGDTLFRDDLFETTCQKIYNQNEARIIQDISRLIVSSAESLATFGAKHLDILIESVNAGWNSSILFIGIRPQPDYSVGFKQDAFTEDQLAKLSPFIGDPCEDQSYFMATHYMCFPFLTCEVKGSTTGLVIADWQNVHSMTLAVHKVLSNSSVLLSARMKLTGRSSPFPFRMIILRSGFTATTR